jgi:hypothetical protein
MDASLCPPAIELPKEQINARVVQHGHTTAHVEDCLSLQLNVVHAHG